VGDLRCKDLTIGDADNDGKNEVILGTHGLGIVRLYDWENDKWKKEDLEYNFISQIDEKEQTNHRVPSEELSCKECTVQSAVHIVKIEDVDNDGTNEVIATISSPLELQEVEEISFINIYKKQGKSWKRTTIDRLSDREFRSITIGDIYNKGRNTILVGIGSPRNEKGSLYTYDLSGAEWKKSIIYNDKEEKNMKGVTYGDIYRDGIQRILLATGFPNGKVVILTWNKNKFDIEEIGKISSLFNLKGREFNSMASIIQRNSETNNLLIGGTTTYPEKKIGWEGADAGFISLFNNNGGRWKSKILDTGNILGMDRLN
jgi:hypothetical protein